MTMLKTNSKKAKENVKKYIIDNYTPESYGEEAQSKKTFEEIAKYIYEASRNEKSYLVNRVSFHKLFEDWAQGLPSLLDTCYYCNRSAVDDLGTILEQTEEERNRYSEEQAEALLTYLIAREIEAVGR